MTRAEDRLIGGRGRDQAGCRLLARTHRRGLKASVNPANQLLGEQTSEPSPDFDFTSSIGEAGWEGDGFELVGIGEIAIPEQIELQIPSEAALPSWIRTAAPDEPDPPTPLAPSQPLPDEAAAEPRAFSPLGGADGKRWQRGLLLPQVATEWGWDREMFLAQTCLKAGLPRDAWKTGATVLKFEAEVFGDGARG